MYFHFAIAMISASLGANILLTRDKLTAADKVIIPALSVCFGTSFGSFIGLFINMVKHLDF